MQLAPQELQTSTSKKRDWMIPFAALTVSTAAFIASLSYAVFSIKTWNAKRDSDLVKIGVGVLRVDPERGKQISAAREWALDLIDANAGGVTFSPEAREQLLRKRLEFDDVSWDYSYPLNPVPPRPLSQPSR